MRTARERQSFALPPNNMRYPSIFLGRMPHVLFVVAEVT